MHFSRSSVSIPMNSMAMTTPEKQLLNKYQFVSGAYVVTKNVNAVIQQGDISVPELPNLPAYQQSAREQGQYWLNTVWPAIQGTSKDIIHYASTFQDTYQQLLDVVNKGGADMKLQIVALTTKLHDDLNSKKTSSDGAISSVKSFSDKFSPIYSQFQKDYAKADAIITGDNQKLIELKARRASLQSEAGQLQLESLIPFAGIYFAIKYGEVVDEINSISRQIAAIKADLSAIQSVHDQLAGLSNHSITVMTLSKSVSDGWQSLADNMVEVISHINSISPDEAAIVVKIQLGAANKDWGNVLEQARGLGLTARVV